MVETHKKEKYSKNKK